MRNMMKAMITLFLAAGVLAACGGDDKEKADVFAEKDWPELEVVKEEIGTDFESADVENDEGNSRVILYENEGKPEYKSVYILDEERLKIISTQDDGEGQIYNEVIR
ncbi:hypothetical protein [Salimicrobium humidisoli]|uniref:PepSY domain-containing protein n=1 Tax=Salimicrobium humidisoli TaxID=2029857 RepID=A0ABX4HUI6_9BACI|nr:hypothetical protein [Salimicrobium humidisoli]PBB06901.1 hypothetical protein CKW00_00120 [Salimicrobium humidisoli]